MNPSATDYLAACETLYWELGKRMEALKADKAQSFEEVAEARRVAAQLATLLACIQMEIEGRR